jgi:hypothetical protein
MLGEQRVLICLLGEIGAEVEQELRARDLDVHRAMTVADAREKVAQGARAIVSTVGNERQMRERLALTEAALRNGALLHFIGVSDQEKATAEPLLEPLTTRRQGLPPSILFTPYQAGKAASVAQSCVRRQPGREAVSNERLTIGVDPEDTPEGEDEYLIRRAFNDCAQLTLRALLGGTMKSGPWWVTAERRVGPHPADFVVKTGPIQDIVNEINKTREFCGDHMPFPYHPPIIEDRCVVGDRRAAAVFSFVDRAVLFSSYIRTHSPAVAIASIFDGPLRSLREHGELAPVYLVRASRKIIPDVGENLAAAHAEACLTLCSGSGKLRFGHVTGTAIST